ncbi:MAG: DinB family protein [Raineya sp.]
MDLPHTVLQAIAHFQKYLESLKKYSQEDFLYKQDEQTWSLGQMYEHLAISSEFFIRQAEGCLREEKGDFEGSKTQVGEQMFALGGFPPIKIKPPEQYKAATEVVARSIDEYQDLFAEFIERLPKLQKTIEQNPTTYKRKHAMFGMLTASEWIWCLETHLRHHFRQESELEGFLKK